jgi:hypothetical protein
MRAYMPGFNIYNDRAVAGANTINIQIGINWPH